MIHGFKKLKDIIKIYYQCAPLQARYSRSTLSKMLMRDEINYNI